MSEWFEIAHAVIDILLVLFAWNATALILFMLLMLVRQSKEAKKP